MRDATCPHSRPAWPVLSTSDASRCDNRCRAGPPRIDREPAARREATRPAAEARRSGSASGASTTGSSSWSARRGRAPPFSRARSARFPGFVDLGEVAPVKAAVPELAALRAGRSRVAPPPDPRRLASHRARRLRPPGRADARAGVPRPGDPTRVSRGARRPHDSRRTRRRLLAPREAVASPRAAPRPTTRACRYGAYARFWVEPERRAEFEAASDARRAAWVWRSYLAAAREGDALELRYEELTADPDARRRRSGALPRCAGRAARERTRPRARRVGRPLPHRPHARSSSPMSRPRPARSCASSGTSRSALPAPDGRSRAEPGASSSARGRRLRDRA